MPMIGADYGIDVVLATARRRGLLSMEIEPSHLCNYRCRYCYLENLEASPHDLHFEEAQRVIRQAKGLGARKIIILGGEPMLTPYLKPLVTFISNAGLDTEIFTNGSRIDAESAQFLFDHRVRTVVKLNSLDVEVNNFLSGNAAAASISHKAITNLLEAGYPGEGQHLLGASTVICRQNIGGLRNLWCWLRDRGIVPYFEMLTPQGNAARGEQLHPDAEDLKSFFHDIAKLDAERYGKSWEPQPPLLGSRCLRHLYSCVVTANGDVFPCVGVPIVIGNIRERSLEAILADSEILDDLRRYQETIQGPCGSCDKASQCYGCRGAAYNLTKNYLASDPTCWLNSSCDCEDQRLPLPAERFVPHAEPFRMVRRLIEVGEGRAVTEAVVPPGSLFCLPDDTLDESVYFELVAQSAAALDGFRRSRQRAEQGFLTGVRSFTIHNKTTAGGVLRVVIKKQGCYMDFGLIHGSVYRGETLLADGEIRILRTGAHLAEASTN